MRKRPERKERDGPGERLRGRERCGEVVAALRRTGRRAPPDDRGRYAVRDDGITRLTSGEVIRRVMPDSVDGYVGDLSCRRTSGQGQRDQCRSQCADE